MSRHDSPVFGSAALAQACCAALALLHAPGVSAAGARESESRIATATAADTGLSFPRLFQELATLGPDSTRVANVTSIEIERDAGVFVLERGTLALCRPVAGRICAAVFTGRGTFVFTPPTEVERDQLQRAYGGRTLRRAFTSLVLLFSDSTLAELRSIAPFGSGDPGAQARAAIGEALPYVITPETHFAQPWIVKPLLDPVGAGLFYAHLSTAAGPLFFAVDPSELESVQLMRRPDDNRFGLVQRHGQEVVSMFRVRGDTAAATGDLTPSVRPTHYSIDLAFKPSLDASAGVDLDVQALEDGQRWLALWLFSETTQDTLKWADGHPAAAWGWKNNPVIWVRCDPPLLRGETRRLHFRYHGRVVEREGNLFFNDDYSDWFPRLDFKTPCTFDLAFHFPPQYQLVASGRRVSSETRGDVLTSRWIMEAPTPWASFDLGLFHTFAIAPESLPPIHVLLADPNHSGLTESLGRAALSAPRSLQHRIVAEVMGEATFYRRMYGPLPPLPLAVVQTTDDVLVGLPQLVHMPLTFRRDVDPDITPYFFRAHEMAHQWWGIAVDGLTYHDAWLSEGFSDFSAAWYLQNAQGTASYLAILKAWRRRILENRKFLFGKTTPAAPVWFGTRTNSSRTAGDYDVIVYSKGAWALHMLRNLMLEEGDPNERRFQSLMHDFYLAHAGGAATTEDFRAAVEQAMGQDMGWFFDQWIYRAEVPTYTFSSRIDRDAQGRYVVHGRVAQSNVPASFRMDVPVRIEYAKGRIERVRVRVQGALTEFELPPAGEPPARVTFNDLESVLCELVEVPWK